ncbi:MAG: hypothetical protein EOO43_02880 [Flavobacterium sp.]|nr:MAG: hypothetical protein EOO43_02880 [Flavobacterium sp.]
MISATEESAFFDGCWDEYYNYCERKKGKATAVKVISTKKLLDAFAKLNYPITFQSIDTNGYDFYSYLIKAYPNPRTGKNGVSASTAARTMGTLSTMLTYSYRQGWHKNSCHKQWCEFMEAPATNIAYLSERQLYELWQYPLPTNSSLDITRDIMLWYSSTGMSVEHVNSWHPSNYHADEEIIEYIIGDKTCYVPLNPISRSILTKYKHVLPQRHIVQLNREIKQILLDMGYAKKFAQSITCSSGKESFIMWMVSKDVTISDMSLMVSNSIQSLVKYYPPSKTKLKEAISRIKFYSLHQLPPSKVVTVKALRKPVNKIMNYAGSKAAYMKEINQIINNSQANIYCESFLGSGVVFFNLQKEFDTYILNDNNPHIVSVFESVKAKSYKQVKHLHDDAKFRFGDFETDKTAYMRLRRFYNESYFKNDLHTEESGIYLLFLINSCINSFVRFTKNGFCASFGERDFTGRTLSAKQYNACRMRLHNQTILCKDYKEVLKEYDGKDVLHFIDAPYHHRDFHYMSTFDKNEFAEFIKNIKKLKGDVVCTDTAHGKLAWQNIRLRNIKNSSPSVSDRQSNNLSEVIYFKIK